MRLVLDTLVVLMLLAILSGVMYHNRRIDEAHQQRELAREELHRLQRQVHLQAALARVNQHERAYPQTIDPAWFQGQLPRNPLLETDRPWLEVAGSSQRGLDHPEDVIAVSDETASFWYNPSAGIVRARVPSGISDAEALKLYNDVNGTNLTGLFK